MWDIERSGTPLPEYLLPGVRSCQTIRQNIAQDDATTRSEVYTLANGFASDQHLVYIVLTNRISHTRSVIRCSGCNLMYAKRRQTKIGSFQSVEQENQHER